MLAGILQGIFLGFVLTAIPGAVVLETARRALAKKSVLSFLGGNFVGTGITILVTIFGLASLLKNASWSHLFYLLSGSTLVYIGLTSLTSRRFIKQQLKKKPERTKSSNKKAFLAGLILTIANPIGILFWISTIGRYLNSHDSSIQIFANCTAIVIGAIVFDVLLLTIIHTTHKLAPQKYLVALTDVFGAIILMYGGFFVSKAFNL